jgi:hypothetical protein
MRGPGLAAIVLVVVFAGCLSRRGGPSDGDPPPDGRGPAEPSQDNCRSNANCGGGEVCARNHTCWPPELLRAVHANWTLRGAAASPTTCAAAPSNLMITFYESNGSRSGEVSFLPIACAQGRYTIDLLPMSYDRVAISRESGADRQEAVIDSLGDALLDLPY